MTLKAVRTLERCPVIATPQTKGDGTLALDIAKGAVDLTGKTILPLRFAMERDPDALRRTHEEAADQVRAYLDQGEDVAMLNLGDVSVYSTYSYLMDILSTQGYETVMVPGVTSFCAVAARLGISLTEMNQPLHILPGSGLGQEALAAELALKGTKVLMKSGRQLPAVLEALEKAGKLDKAAMVSSCGLPNEAVFRDLRDFPTADQAGYFATIVVKD
jgi:precorrin-2/cobalt-factor-2 C20-methyltransferase